MNRLLEGGWQQPNPTDHPTGAELIERLREGKVYIQDQIVLSDALDRFEAVAAARRYFVKS